MSNDGEAQHWDRVASTLLDVEAPSLGALADVAATAVGAADCRLLIADYSLRYLRPVESDGSVGEIIPVEGTMAGRCFASGEPVSNGDASPTTWLPLNDCTERIGVAELRFATAVQPGPDANLVMELLGLAIVSRRRYTDVIHRARRTRPMSEAAEAQWDLLPPLAHAVAGAAVAGALEPAYSIGGDSFDYAFNPGRLDFAVLDAAGHGLDAVLMCAAAVHSLRNARRSSLSLAETYAQIDRRIRLQFGNSYFVTGHLCSLDVTDGTLTWINAGHVLPLHVRDRTLIGEVECIASLPMGLGGDVREIASVQLQRGDRLLFYTDGVTESRSADGDTFGVDRLADFVVRATIDAVPLPETVRRLTANVVDHVRGRLRDDATVFMVDYSG